MLRIPPAVRLGLGLSVLALACAPGTGVLPRAVSSPAPTTAATLPPDPEPAEVIIGLGGAAPPRTLNPLLGGPDTAVLDRMAAAVFAIGYSVAPETLVLVPEALAEIPSVTNGGIVDNGDGTIDVTVRLAPGVVWSDGVPLKGDDLVFTHELIVDPELPIRSDLRTRHQQIVPGSLAATDGELSFRMESSLDVELLFPYIVPRHQVEGSDFLGDWNDEMWLGAGPFVYDDYRAGQFLVLRRNPLYWRTDPATGDQLPYLDRVVFRFFDHSDPRLLGFFESRELDVVSLGAADGDAEAYRALEPQGAAVELAPSLGWLHLNFQFGPGNRNAESLNRHREFRRAVAHAIDRNQLASERGTTPLFSFLRLYRPDLAQDPWGRFPFDPDQTAFYLDELGRGIDRDLLSGSGPRLVLSAPSGSTATVATAGSVVVMLNDAGIAAELQLEDPALLFGRTLDNGTWDTATWRFTAGPGRARAVVFVEMFDPNGLPFVGTNFYRWGTVDSNVQNSATRLYGSLIEDLDRTVDPAEVDALLLRLEDLLAEEMVLLPLITHDRVGVAYWPDMVQGPTVNPAQGLTWNLSTWRRVDR